MTKVTFPKLSDKVTYDVEIDYFHELLAAVAPQSRLGNFLHEASGWFVNQASDDKSTDLYGEFCYERITRKYAEEYDAALREDQENSLNHLRERIEELEASLEVSRNSYQEILNRSKIEHGQVGEIIESLSAIRLKYTVAEDELEKSKLEVLKLKAALYDLMTTAGAA